MNIIQLKDHRRVLVNPTFMQIREEARKAGWRNWDTFPQWFEKDGEPQVKIIMRRR